jgi:nitroreductase
MVNKVDVIKAIKTRRTIRKFRSTSISDETVKTIIDAARWAPSGGNSQPWKFIIIRNQLTINKIRELFLISFQKYYFNLPKDDPRHEKAKKIIPKVKDFYKNAPVFIAVFVEWKRYTPFPGDTIGDAFAAIENMMLAAWALGLGSAWLNMLPEQEIKNLLEVPSELRFVACIPIGYPEELPVPPPRKPIEEITHYEKYGIKQHSTNFLEKLER